MKIPVLAAVVVLLPFAATAADPTKTAPAPDSPTTGISFEALDANKDGRISMPEASADPRLVETFSTADKNGDGYLDSAEYANAARQPPQR